MKSHLSLLVIIASFAAASAQAQQAMPLDEKSAAAVLSQVPERPKLVPKAADPEVRREYSAKSARIIVRQSGRIEEAPYVPVPILFVRSTDKILDAVSQENLRKLAAILVKETAGGGEFAIEGHTSVEGDMAANQELSEKRAAKILSILTTEFSVPAGRLHAVGYGPRFAVHKLDEPNEERQKDRRAVVVRER